jgi:hypothetical protein
MTDQMASTMPERPGALQEAVNRTEDAGEGESQHKPRAALFERVAGHHGGDREEAEGCKTVHGNMAFRLRQVKSYLINER